MKISILSFCFVLFISILRLSSALDNTEDFVTCLTLKDMPMKNIITRGSPRYTPTLDFATTNLRYNTPETAKPVVILTPETESHLVAAINCAKQTGFTIRIRSGGHDFEGRSYVADQPFVVVDMLNFRSIDLDVEKGTVWVGGGATQGELLYKIGTNTKTLGFPGGEFPSVGVGGFISGGGYGFLQRKYGLAADRVIDARVMDVNGKLLDRKLMGEDYFWALRGGGGGAFGIVLAWKVQLVPVPPKVTVFSIAKTLEERGVEDIVHRWQYVADKLPEDLFVRISGFTVESRLISPKGKTTIQFLFQCMFLGEVDQLLAIMKNTFPELVVTRKDCSEMTWIDSFLYFNGLKSLEDLRNRYYAGKQYFKAKTDYVQEPIPLKGLQGMYELYLQQSPGAAAFFWTPCGGKMSEIPESEIPYPHRAGNRYIVFQAVAWNETESEAKALQWMNNLYSYLAPYVSKNPRRAYVNYRDLDLGVTTNDTTPEQAKSWGVKFFKDNYERLVTVKTMVDPDNFFRNEQSIPPFFPSGKAKEDATTLGQTEA